MVRAGDANAQHYFVATQEKALRGALGKVPGGASVFLNANGVHLEPPSERQRRGIKQVPKPYLQTLNPNCNGVHLEPPSERQRKGIEQVHKP